MKWTIGLVLLVGVFISGIILLSNNRSTQTDTTGSDGSNVSIVDGRQIIELGVRGGYQPRLSVAKSGMPTTIRFNTTNTFDCSSAVRIPSLNIYKVLPQTGSTDIDIGTSTVGRLNGSCGMGMYRFDVDFK